MPNSRAIIEEWRRHRYRGWIAVFVLLGLFVSIVWIAGVGHSKKAGHAVTAKCLVENRSMWIFSSEDIAAIARLSPGTASQIAAAPWVTATFIGLFLIFNLRQGAQRFFPDMRCPACERFVYPTRPLGEALLHWKDDANPSRCPHCDARLR